MSFPLNMISMNNITQKIFDQAQVVVLRSTLRIEGWFWYRRISSYCHTPDHSKFDFIRPTGPMVLRYIKIHVTGNPVSAFINWIIWFITFESDKTSFQNWESYVVWAFVDKLSMSLAWLTATFNIFCTVLFIRELDISWIDKIRHSHEKYITDKCIDLLHVFHNH